MLFFLVILATTCINPLVLVQGDDLEDPESERDDDDILTFANERLEDDEELKLHAMSNQLVWKRLPCQHLQVCCMQFTCLFGTSNIQNRDTGRANKNQTVLWFCASTKVC